MRLLSLDGQPVDLMMVQQRLLGNYSQLLIDMCGITDRSDPQRGGAPRSLAFTSFTGFTNASSDLSPHWSNRNSSSGFGPTWTIVHWIRSSLAFTGLDPSVL